MRKLRKDDVHIVVPSLGDLKLWKLIVYGDASHISFSFLEGKISAFAEAVDAEF